MSYLNSNYYTKNVASEYRFDDFKNNIHFITDAKKFLTGDRLNYSVEEVNEMDKDEVINRVQKHFRFKSGNPTTIVKDLSYMDRDTVSQDEKEAYARLSFAFENTKGEGFMEAGTDYFVSEVVNPVNWASLVAGVFTGGTATVAMQTALKKGGTKAAQELLKQLNKKALKTSAIKGAVASGGTEGAISHFNEKMLEDAGELIDEDYNYSLANVGISTGVGGVTGGVLGGLSGRQMVKSSSGVLDNFIHGEKIRKARNANADKLAQELLEKGYKLNKKTKKSGKNATLDKLTNSLAALDPDRVATGSDIKKAILENDIPKCTPDERWHKPGVFALMKAGRKSSIKNSATLEEAKNYCKEKSIDLNNKTFAIVERPGSDNRCESYCNVNQFCNYYLESKGEKND